jgi:hypothetical protein
MIEDMTLAGLAEATQKIYTQAVYRLAKHYRRSPDQLDEEEVRAYLLGLRQRGVARGTFQTSRYGLHFLWTGCGFPWAGEFVCTRPRSWILSGATESGRSPFSGGSEWLEASVGKRFLRNLGLSSLSNLSCRISRSTAAVRHRN